MIKNPADKVSMNQEQFPAERAHVFQWPVPDGNLHVDEEHKHRKGKAGCCLGYECNCAAEARNAIIPIISVASYTVNGNVQRHYRQNCKQRSQYCVMLSEKAGDGFPESGKHYSEQEH
jgi:hypothetical protein